MSRIIAATMPARSLLIRLLRALFFAGLCCYLGLIGLALYSDHLLYYPPTPSSYGPNSNILQLRAEDGTSIAAAYFPNDKATFTILFSHGNAEDLGTANDTFEYLRSGGFAVFAYDYPGYGLSGGKPSESGLYRAEEAAYEYLVQQLHLPPQRIIVYGRSLGAAPAIYLASRKPVAGLVSDSGFASAFRVLTHVPLLPWDKFRNIDRISQVHCPVLIMQGMQDTVIPTEHGRMLFARANPPKYSYWVPNAGHNEVILAEHYLDTIQQFAATLPASRPAGSH